MAVSFVAVDSTCFKPCYRITVGEARRWLLRVPFLCPTDNRLTGCCDCVCVSVCSGRPSFPATSHKPARRKGIAESTCSVLRAVELHADGIDAKVRILLEAAWMGNDRTNNLGCRLIGSKGKKVLSKGRRPDQKHGRDGKGFLGCLIFSQA